MLETKAKKKNLRDFALLIANRIEPLRDNEDFKNFSKDLNMKVLLNATDAKYAALISVKNGTFTVDGILNDDKKALKKKALGWNGKIATTSLIFFEMATRKFTQGEMLKKILSRKIKIKGVPSLIAFQKMVNFLEEESPKHGIKIDKNKTLIAARLFYFTGILHGILGILARGLLELSVTALIFSFFVILLARILIKLIKYNVMNERPVIISCTTICFLNTTTYLTLILTGATEGRFYLDIFMVILIGFNVINFTIFFGSKAKFDQMDNTEKISYFSIVILRGMGIGLLFQILGYIGNPPKPNYIMIIYILIFGIANMFYGERLYSKRKKIGIHIGAIITLVIGFVFAVILTFIFPSPKFVVYVILLMILIAIRIFYFYEKWTSGMLKSY